MSRSLLFFFTCTAAVVTGWTVACADPEPEPEHCFEALGDATCAERYGAERPYCNGCDGQAPDSSGCVAEPPEDSSCYSPCGGGAFAADDDSCLVGDDTDADTDTDAEVCEGPGDCPTDRPICEASTGECVSCDEAASPDEACAEADSTLPICSGGSCVACTDESPGACAGTTPVCNVSLNRCEPCTEHTQCDRSGNVGVCQLETGACFAMSDRLFVDNESSFCDLSNGLPQTPYCSIEEALESTSADEVAIVLAPRTYEIELVVDRKVAMVADRNSELFEMGERPLFLVEEFSDAIPVAVHDEGSLFLKDVYVFSDSGAITVSGSGAKLQLDDCRVGSNGTGIAVSQGEVTIRRGVIAQGPRGIAASAGAHLSVTNSVFAYHTLYSLDIVVSSVEILYSTFIALNNASAAIRCADLGAGSWVRNSIVVTEGDAPAFNCSGIERFNTPSEAELNGSWLGGWFSEFAPFGLISGQFPETLASEGVWLDGDPPTDIDGDPRPSRDGAPDFIGADRVP